MGMAGGAYKGDMERARLALQAQSIANQAAAQRRAAALREQELNQRQQMIDAARREREAAAERASMHGKAGRKNLGGGVQEPVSAGGRRASMPGGQGEAPAGRQSPYSVSAFDLGAAARQRANDQRLMALERQNQMLGQFQQVVGMERQQAAAKKAQGQSTVASLMKMAMQNGGTAPMAALQLATRQMGFDGKTAAIGGAGYTADGTFYMDFIQKDNQTGQISRATNTLSRADQGRVYYGQQGIFTNADRAAWRQQMLGARYSDQEINQLAGLNATAIEGLDEAGRQRLADGFVDPTTDVAWQSQYNERMKQVKMEEAKARIAKALGQQELTPAQDFAFSNFSKFGGDRDATEEEIKAGKATDVGDANNPHFVIAKSNEEAFNAAIDFYNRQRQSQDPATQGAQPAPKQTGEEETPTGDQPPAGEEAPAGGDAALPKEAREIVKPQEAPADGQGEFDFGGEGGAAPAPAEGGEGGAPAEGGGEAAPAPAEGAAPAGGGDGAPPPPPPPPPAEGGEAPDGGEEAPAGAGGAGGAPAEGEPGEEEEDDTLLKSNPFARWVPKKNRKQKK